jgi:transcription elongation factor Elf1
LPKGMRVTDLPKEKRCPRCQTVKEVAEFYRVRSRSDGLASWCKKCSNGSRKYHKSSKKRPGTVSVAEAVKRGDKPTTCPTCGAEDVPSHMMRGLALPNEQILWDCVTCRNTRNRSLEGDPVSDAEAEKVLWGCQWCEEEEMVTAEKADRDFCSEECRRAYQEVTNRTVKV